MNFDLAESLDILQRTPSILDPMLRTAAPQWLAANEGDGTWNAIEIVGHLIFGEETDWVPRARIILEQQGDPRFTPFDRLGMFGRYSGWSIDRLLDRFAELRQLLGTWGRPRSTHLAQLVRVTAGRYRDDVGPWIAYLSALTR
jgi:hypothetical protein